MRLEADFTNYIQNRLEAVEIFSETQLDSEKILADNSTIPFVIFILGESTDRNHMQLYGYRLPTTPRNQ